MRYRCPALWATDLFTFAFAMTINRYFLHLAYDGTAYHGWQLQPNALTVQQVIEGSLSLLLSRPVSITGAGRTDTGVHARNYYAHFDTDIEFSPQELNQLVYRLNRILPNDISLFSAFKVDTDVHARFSATSRTYRYFLSRNKDPFSQLYAWQYTGNLNVDAMNEAAVLLLKHNDFTCFSKSGTDNKTNLCVIQEIWLQENGSMLVFHVKADRFLRNMVRAIMGTLMDIGKGKIDAARFEEILHTGTRSDAGESVPAKGLFLEKVDYPEGIVSPTQMMALKK